MSISNHATIDRMPIDSLRPFETVVRRHPKKQEAILQRGLQKFGQVIPVPVTPDYRIIDLEAVWNALKKNGATHVDVVVVENKSPEEYKALRLALNRIALDAVWDDEGLRTVLEELISVDFDLDLTGFSAPEIDLRLNLDLPQANVEENGSDIPALEAIAISARGVIWDLGNNNYVGCGDATDPEFVNRVLNGRLADVAFIDAPYNIKIAGFVSGKGKHHHREFVQGSGELSTPEFSSFLGKTFAALRPNCAAASLIFSCIDWRHLAEMNVAAETTGLRLYNICVWVKANAGMTGGIYRNAHEFVCVYANGTEAPLNNVELGRHGRNRTNVWSYPGTSSFSKERAQLLELHPTVKPVAMIADVLRDVTRRGDIVVDTFLGSGSTLMAAHETGRVCCGCDLDPLYVDVTVRRWQQRTGREAVCVETGETFDAIARLRQSTATQVENDGT